jgi:hypothetical protein
MYLISCSYPVLIFYGTFKKMQQESDFDGNAQWNTDGRASFHISLTQPCSFVDGRTLTTDAVHIYVTDMLLHTTQCQTPAERSMNPLNATKPSNPI